MSTIERTATITVPDDYWKLASPAIRELRKILQAAGGHSKLVKSDETITFSAKGPTPSVLQTMDAVQRIGEMCQKSRSTRKQKIVDGLKASIERAKQSREDSFLGALADELLRKKNP